MAPTDTLNQGDARHLLRRAGYGGTTGEVNTLTGMTRENAVAAVMGFNDGDPTPNGPDVGKPGWVVNEDQWEVHGQVIDWWVERMATLPNPTAAPGAPPATAGNLPIYERLAFFWHDHFACAQDKVFDIEAMWDQLRMFRRLALGSFDALVRAVSVHPAMLVHLDNQHNTVWEPQENFGREIMELYTCGVGEFTENDVVAMTNAWTGHNTVGWNDVEEFWDSTYVYDTERHDHGQKTLFGITANWNGIAQHGGERDTIDELCHGVRQDATADRITRLLFKYLANLIPSSSTLDELSTVFKNNNMEVAPLVRAILLHDDFWGADSRWGQVKNPLDFIVSLVKQLDLDVDDLGLHWRMYNMGMVPLDPPSVAGWGSGMAWLSTASSWGRGQFASSLRWRTTGDESPQNLFDGLEDVGAVAAAQAIFDQYEITDPANQTRNALEDWFNDTHSAARWSITPQAVMLGALLPEFQVY